MANNVLKEFLVAVGFKVDTSSYKRMTDDVDRVGKRLNDLDHQDRTRAESEKKRTEERKAGYNGLALALGGVAVAATAAAGVVAAAVGKMVGGFDQFYFISQRTGASVNNLKAIGYAFSQVGSTAESALQAIESFAQKRRTNPGIDGLLRSYGVDTKGDTADVLNRSVQAIQDRHPYYTGSQVAGLLGITEEQFQTFTKYRAEIKRYREEYARLQRDLNVNSDETARASASVSRSIGTITATLGVLAEKFFSTVAPVLERMVDGLRRWIAAHPEEIDRMMQGVARALEAVGMGLAKVGEWFSDEGNLNKFMGFWTNVYGAIERVVKIVTALLDAMFKLSNVFNSGPVKKYLDFMFGGGLLGGSIFGTSAQAAGFDGEGGSSRAPGGVANDNGGTKPSLVRRGWNAVKRTLGLGGDSSGGTQARPPEAAGRYRPVYKLSDADLDQRVVNTIAGEVSTKNGAGVDAVINNMLNRVGSKGWGPSGNLLEVARAKGQYAGYRVANAVESEFVRSRIKAISTGGVPDNTNGSNSYRAESYYRGAGRNKTWAQTSVIGPNVAGNRYGFVPGAANGPYKPYTNPKDDTTVARPGFGSGSASNPAMSPGGFNVDDALRSRPMGTTSNATDNSRSVVQNNPVTVNVQGANDPAATGAAVARGVAGAGDMNVRNVQTAIR